MLAGATFSPMMAVRASIFSGKHLDDQPGDHSTTLEAKARDRGPEIERRRGAACPCAKARLGCVFIGPVARS
jgi:hypothetical protein